MEQLTEAILEIKEQLSFNAFMQSLQVISIVLCLAAISISNRNRR